MANPFQIIYSQIHLEIPYEILEIAFPDEIEDENIETKSLDQRLTDLIIIPIVIPRVNSYTGKTKYIEIKPQYAEVTRDTRVLGNLTGGRAYRIPPEARENLDIVDVRGIRGKPYYADDISTPNNAFNLQYNLLASHTYGTSQVISSTPIMRGSNIIIIKPALNSEGVLIEVVLGYDKYLSSLPNHAHMPFANYTVSMLKSYIRTNINIPVDAGELIGGMQTSLIREYLNDWREETTEKQSLLLQTIRGSGIVDTETFERYLKTAL